MDGVAFFDGEEPDEGLCDSFSSPARAGAKAVAPPPALARSAAPGGSLGLGTPKLLGDAQAGARRPVALAVADARYHLHVMGATGSPCSATPRPPVPRPAWPTYRGSWPTKRYKRRWATVADDTVGLGGFWESYEAMSEANRAQVIGPLMNKLRAFLLRDFVRQVVGRPDSSFDMGRILDGGVCLVRVPKGILGEDTARLLGSFVVAKVWQTATHRARLGQAARVDASLVVDECQNFLHLPGSFEELLAEARGYRLSMVLAHQHLGQLRKELRESVSANARTKVWFTMSPEDARALERPPRANSDKIGSVQRPANSVIT